MIQYKVNKESGVVTAYIEGCEQEVIDLLKRKTGMTFSKLKFPNKLEARAVCHPEDTFDEQVGKSIARKRLLAKYNKKKIRLLDKASDMAVNILTTVDHELERAQRIHEKYDD